MMRLNIKGVKMKKSILFCIVLATSLFATKIDFEFAPEDVQRVDAASKQNEILSYHSSIADAKKAVVNISTTKTITRQNHPMSEFFDDPFFKEFFGFNFGMPQERSRKASSLGSGVIISKDGYIVTNNHVVESADEILVTMLDDDQEFEAKLIGSDPKTDIAIIKIEKKNLEPIKFGDSSKLLEGDVVFAIGNPFGVGGTITQGIISALNKSNLGLNQYENFIQTDASINPGNSGGALVDSRGALIGINSAILSQSGGNNGVGFAIPSNMVRDIAKKLIEDGKIERGFIGVYIANLTKDQKELYKSQYGALITNVEKDKPADKAGIKRGDLIIKVDGVDIKSANDLKNEIGAKKPNTKIKIVYERSKKIRTAELKLGSMSDAATQVDMDSKSPIEGLSVTELSDEIRSKFRVDKDTNGVFVTKVTKDSKAQEYGFRQNDIITQIGEHEIKSIGDFEKILKSMGKDKKALVWVMRNRISIGIVIN